MKTGNGTKMNENKERSFYWVDSYANGISFGQSRIPQRADWRDAFPLQLADAGECHKLRARYALNKSNPLHELELNLMKLSGQGNLSSSIICLGAVTDPFLPFEGRFHASLKFLELFLRYKPGLLLVQTRSPLIVLAMPVLRKLGKQVSVTIAVETCDQKVANQYIPALPAVEERIKAAAALRNFGVEVHLQVAPLLPYGDWRKDAPRFASLLCKHADFVHVMPLCGDSSMSNKTALTAELARKLAYERKFHWLRPDAANPLISAIEDIAPEKLILPDKPSLQDRQLDIFAA